MIKPQVAKRLEQCVGQDFDSRDCRVTNPHITARESIELADYIASVEVERDALSKKLLELQGSYDFANRCISERNTDMVAAAVIEFSKAAFDKSLKKRKGIFMIITFAEQYVANLRQQAEESHHD